MTTSACQDRAISQSKTVVVATAATALPVKNTARATAVAASKPGLSFARALVRALSCFAA